jgi:cytochrome P450
MCMDVRFFLNYSFPAPAHCLCLGVFAASNSDVIHLRSLVPYNIPQLLIADATASKVGTGFWVVVLMFNLSVQVVFHSRTAFPKVTRNIKAGQDAAYGPSIAIAEQEEWRKHRRIAGPSFSESNNVLVWESTIEIILGYFTRWNRDGKGSTVMVSDFTEVTTQVAYMVFSTAGTCRRLGHCAG